MKKSIKWLSGIAIGVLLLGLVAFKYLDVPKPDTVATPEADELALQMFEAINKAAWDTTHYVGWTFRDNRHFVWDKFAQKVQVQWEDYKVVIHTDRPEGRAFQNGAELKDEAQRNAVDKAWSLFCNDSFWLNAPAKAFDPGTKRSLVDLEEGGTGLMVEYSSGGVTPGDSYLWILDENYLPKAWRMWVSIMPVGGVETSWESWTTISTGAKLAEKHIFQGNSNTLIISNIRGGATLASIGVEKDPFKILD
ncbi:MAG TPA: hypothetical protein PKA00_01435 [Saprospiraceae bacterium]|nr:hypothetical protein [Saprospiraceae bacterium]HMQ81531.1 hypothetical protein [Saprospiraceae bacterium]